MTMANRVVVVTGAARGIGLSVARHLIAGGATVMLGDIDGEQLRVVATGLGLDTYAHLDVANPSSFRDFLDHTERTLGPVDVLVNNAGVMPVGPLHEESDALSRKIINVNLLGVIWGTKGAVRHMLPRGRGHVINVSSIAGETHVPGAATYCASKHAVSAFTESARLEYHGTGIEFSCVLPGFTNTELIAGTRSPMVGSIEPERIAHAVVRLIERPRPVVRVPKGVGAISIVQRLAPRGMFGTLLRATGGDKLFINQVDSAARQRYVDRIAP